jgi:hypothetical protein
MNSIKIPSEIWVHIFGIVDAKSLSRLARVCTEFRAIASDEQLWKALHLQRYGEHRSTVDTWKKSYQRKYSTNLSNQLTVTGSHICVSLLNELTEIEIVKLCKKSRINRKATLGFCGFGAPGSTALIERYLKGSFTPRFNPTYSICLIFTQFQG